MLIEDSDQRKKKGICKGETKKMSSILLTSLGQRESILKGVSGQHEESYTSYHYTIPMLWSALNGKKIIARCLPFYYSQ